MDRDYRLYSANGNGYNFSSKAKTCKLPMLFHNPWALPRCEITEIECFESFLRCLALN